MGELAPSIISANFAELGAELAAVAPFSARWHVDVMDGHYVPNLTIGPMVVSAIAEATSLPQDVHLMISNPEETWEWYAKAGAARIAFHPDAASDVTGLLRSLQGAGVGAGLAINPDVDVADVARYLPDVDHLVVMSVHPGFSGQRFIPSALDKLRTLRGLVDRGELNAQLIIDGGVNDDTAPKCVEAGADVLVSASAIFGARHPAEVAERLARICR